MELTQTRLDEDSPLQPHIDLILEAARKLAGATFTVPQPLLVMVLLVSLPPSYATVVTSLHTTITASSPSDRARTLTFKFVSDRLLEHERMQKLQQVEGTALVAKKKAKGKQSKKPKKSQKPDDSSERKCSNCSATTHRLEDCYVEGGPKYKPPKGKDKRKSDGKANVMQSDTVYSYESDEESACMATTGKPSVTSPDEWLIDSGASSHFCSKRSAFTTYRKTSQTVRIGDDSALRASGQGSVPLSVLVSRKAEILQLRNVVHVPDIAVNLLSASKLSEYGELVFTGLGCRLVSRSGHTLLEGIRKDNLYYLKRENMDSALLMTSSRASKREPPPIDLDLAHQRLGHLNAKAIDMLSKGDIAKGLILKSPIGSSATVECVPCRGSTRSRSCGPMWTN